MNRVLADANTKLAKALTEYNDTDISLEKAKRELSEHTNNGNKNQTQYEIENYERLLIYQLSTISKYNSNRRSKNRNR